MSVDSARCASSSAVEGLTVAGLGVAVVDQDEPDCERNRGVEAEKAEPGPGWEAFRVGMDDEDLAAGLHRGVGADRGLPGLRQELQEDRRHEQQPEQRGDRAGANADDRAEAQAEQSEYRQVETASGDRPEHAGIADLRLQAVVGEERLKDEV